MNKSHRFWPLTRAVMVGYLSAASVAMPLLGCDATRSAAPVVAAADTTASVPGLKLSEPLAVSRQRAEQHDAWVARMDGFVSAGPSGFVFDRDGFFASIAKSHPAVVARLRDLQGPATSDAEVVQTLLDGIPVANRHLAALHIAPSRLRGASPYAVIGPIWLGWSGVGAKFTGVDAQKLLFGAAVGGAAGALAGAIVGAVLGGVFGAVIGGIVVFAITVQLAWAQYLVNVYNGIFVVVGWNLSVSLRRP